ncbi:MAG TPA: discoidin domain-containing protein, partial [Trueperaceae bacterium]|nr:discoidin domain-containing protein [Trueperaceae bacterium]
MARPLARWSWRLLAGLLATLLTGAALAQQCMYELEPNDVPAAATVLSGEGPDAVVAAAKGVTGTICLAGEMARGDQDAFAWVIDEAQAANVWQLEIEGPSGGLTQVDLVDVEFAAAGGDVTGADTLFRFGTSDGSRAVSAPFMVTPGRLLLGLSHAQAAGAYVVNLRPTPLADDSAEHRAGQKLDGPFDVFAPLAGGVEVPFTLGAESGGFVWNLELRAPLGTAPTLVLAGPEGEVGRIAVNDHAPVRLANLGLAPGDYRATVVPGSPAEAGFVTVALTSQGRRSDGIEVEPNDKWADATRFPLGSELRGTAESRDHLRIDVPADLAGSTWDLAIEADAEVTLQLRRPEGAVLQERRGVSGTSPGLTLAEGAYQLIVSSADDAAYTVALTSAAPPADGYEREPNDRLEGATPLGAEAQARGELRPQDVDFFRLDVSGEAQRFRLQAVGRGVEQIGIYDAAGRSRASVRGEGRLRLDDVVLLPGAHYLRVSGAEGEYAVRALALGPAPAQQEAEDAPAPGEALAPAPKVDASEGSAEEAVEQAVEEAVEAPAAAELPPLPPPPPGLLEYEPNDDRSRAVRLRPDVVHVGRLASADDEDHYRFGLATDQYVRIELVPAEPDPGWMLTLDNQNQRQLPTSPDGRVVAERWLLAGDHELYLAGRRLDTTPSGYYQLRLTSLGSFDLPVDLEPNDVPAEASALPADLAWQGRVGAGGDRDLYVLPSYPADTLLRLVVEADDQVRFDVLLAGGSQQFAAVDDAHEITLPAGSAAHLRFLGAGEYDAELTFESPPAAEALLPAPAGDRLAVDVTLAVDEATAFWHEGQRVAGTVSLSSSLDEPVTLDLVAAVDDPLARVDLPAVVEVGAGATVEVPFSLELPSDMGDDAPLTLELAASSPLLSAVGDARLGLRCEASPLSPHAYWPLPEPLLGRPNVLFAGFGASAPPGFEGTSRDRWLADDRVAVSTGSYVSEEHSPTFQLPGDEPVALVGTVLQPLSDVAVGEQLRRFRVETSLDGVTFKSVLEAELGAARVDQAFVFPEPVTARYARLVFVDSQGGGNRGFLGEWQLIAADPALFSGLDLAAPSFGGHVVWSEPLLGQTAAANLLLREADSGRVDLRGREALDVVIGFNHGRAALVNRVTWLQPAESKATELFDLVEVAVSMSGPAGPWRVLGEWPLAPSPDSQSEIAFEEPVWARYVRLSAPKTATGDRFYYPPQKVAIHEAEIATAGVDHEYRSALAAWGTASRLGPYEWAVGFPAAAGSEPEAPNDTPATATPLAAGAAVTGTVAVAEDLDWYRVSVPAGENHLELRLAGDPAIAYRYELLAADGSTVPV